MGPYRTQTPPVKPACDHLYHWGVVSYKKEVPELWYCTRCRERCSKWLSIQLSITAFGELRFGIEMLRGWERLNRELEDTGLTTKDFWPPHE